MEKLKKTPEPRLKADIPKLYLQSRRALVDWLCEIGEAIKMSQITIHHACTLMDVYLSSDNMEVSNDEEGKKMLQLLTLTSLFVSAKFNEKDSCGPTARDIQHITKSKYKDTEVIKMEITLLKQLDWELKF